jgi:hypothetical protein
MVGGFGSAGGNNSSTLMTESFLTEVGFFALLLRKKRKVFHKLNFRKMREKSMQSFQLSCENFDAFR